MDTAEKLMTIVIVLVMIGIIMAAVMNLLGSGVKGDESEVSRFEKDIWEVREQCRNSDDKSFEKCMEEVRSGG